MPVSFASGTAGASGKEFRVRRNGCETSNHGTIHNSVAAPHTQKIGRHPA